MDILSDLEAYDLGRVRNGQVELGPSNTDTCLRRSGFRHHGVEPTEPRSKGLAWLGTLLHLGWSEVVRATSKPQDRLPDYEVEVPGLKAPGHADDVDFDRRVVNDLKSKSDRSWMWWVTNGVPDGVWDQVELYAYGLSLDEDLLDDDRPWTLRITALNRETGQEAIFEQPADPERGALLAERLVDRQATLDASTTPYDLPQEGSGPDRGFPCDYCEWTTACWGPPRPDGLSRQAATVVDDPAAVESVGEQYLAAQAAIRPEDEALKDARAYLQGIPAGDYGGIRLRWQGGRDLPPVPDLAAATRALEAAGLTVPMKPHRSARSLRVLRVPPADV